MTLTGFELLAHLFKLPLPLRGSYLYLNFNTLHNREKKSLRHVATVTKFLAENKAKVNYDTVTNFIDLSQLHLICQMLTKFSGYLFQKKIKRKFLCYVHLLYKAGVYEKVSCRSRASTAKKCTKKRDASAKQLFCLYKPIVFLFFLPYSLSSPSSLLKLSIVFHW